MKTSHKIHDSEWKRAAPPPDSPYRVWLLDRGSLTARIQARCAAFSVRGVHQRLARPCRDEVRELCLPTRELALTREVFLYCKATPVVFAHTVLPRTALRGPWHYLATQGSKPLGATLFGDPKVARLPLHFKKLTAGHELFQRAQRVLKASTDCLWARRSLFIVERAPLMVTEVFLPGILELPA